MPAFLERCRPVTGDSVYDLGCGTGRAGRALAAAGLTVKLIDVCREAIEVPELPFLDATLWDLPPGLQPADWIFCVDALEHLPTEYVGPTLDDLARLTIKGGLLKIACFEDACGAMIGESLHLTIQPALWWLQRIKARWDIIHADDSGGYLTAFVGGRRGK